MWWIPLVLAMPLLEPWFTSWTSFLICLGRISFVGPLSWLQTQSKDLALKAVTPTNRTWILFCFSSKIKVLMSHKESVISWVCNSNSIEVVLLKDRVKKSELLSGLAKAIQLRSDQRCHSSSCRPLPACHQFYLYLLRPKLWSKHRQSWPSIVDTKLITTWVGWPWHSLVALAAKERDL